MGPVMPAVQSTPGPSVTSTRPSSLPTWQLLAVQPEGGLLPECISNAPSCHDTHVVARLGARARVSGAAIPCGDWKDNDATVVGIVISGRELTTGQTRNTRTRGTGLHLFVYG